MEKYPVAWFAQNLSEGEAYGDVWLLCIVIVILGALKISVESVVQNNNPYVDPIRKLNIRRSPIAYPPNIEMQNSP